MFQIGEFSRIARVTIETLRHYDTIGLLKPAKVDPNTGYRYYNVVQLQALNQILALKEVGLSLDEIKRILRQTLTVDEVRGMLREHLVLTESTIEEAQRRRQGILARLERLDTKEEMPQYEIRLKSAESVIVVAIREVIPTVEQIPRQWNQMFTKIANWMKENKLSVGVPMAFYHDEHYTVENVDTECAFTVLKTKLGTIPEPIKPIEIRQLEAIPHVATTVVTNFHVKVGGLENAYKSLGQWVVDNDYHIIAAPREIYYGTPQTGDFTAEIQFPVSK
ncbi:MAG: MerR family transcriptional regulator [Anaerolineae bacterium]